MVTEGDEPQPELHEEPEGGPVKSFLDHLEDLRWMLIKCVAAIGVTMLVCLIASNQVVSFLKWPLKHAHIKPTDPSPALTLLVGTNRLGTFHLGTNQVGELLFGTNRNTVLQLEPILIGSNLVLALRPVTNGVPVTEAEQEINLNTFGPASGFFIAFKVAIYAGIFLASPLLFYFIGQFVFPALKLKEKKYVFQGMGVGVVLFTTGVAFCYFLLMPVALKASVQYSEWLGFSADQWRAEDYLGFVCKFMLGMGLGFEMPVIILTLVKIGILNYRMLAGFRRYMIVINLVLGAVLTTPEVITQVLMFVPLQLLYEITIWIAWYWERRDRKRAEAAGDPVD